MKVAARRRFARTLVLLLASAPLASANGFDEKVRAILLANCLPCHDEATKASGFSVASVQSIAKGGARRGPAIKPGDPKGSPLIQMVRGELAPRMPMGAPLTDEQIATIENWIREAPVRSLST